jgi:MFS family permease
MVTLILMGIATTLVGLLPTYAAIGIAAPILLCCCASCRGSLPAASGAGRCSWPSSTPRARGVFGASPQMGVPLGLLLASGMLALMALIAPGEAFLQWGWRVPFLLSFVLIVIGYYVRRRVEESPVFAELAERKEETRMPIVSCSASTRCS